MKFDNAFEIERNRLAGLHALRDRMMQRDSIDALLARATPRPAPIFNLSRPQIAVVVALALCLGLSLGAVAATREWADGRDAQPQIEAATVVLAPASAPASNAGDEE